MSLPTPPTVVILIIWLGVGSNFKALGFLPNLFAAGLILVIGWFVARIVQRIVSNLLAAVGVDRSASG